jgi:hypothetical protein
VRGVTTCDHLLEMPVLGIDDVVGGLTLVLVVAWPTELLASHRFHQLTAFYTSFAILIVVVVLERHDPTRPAEAAMCWPQSHSGTGGESSFFNQMVDNGVAQA